MHLIPIRSDQIRSVAQSCPTLCDPMNHSTSGLPVHHQLLEFTQTHIHRVSDAIQPSHSLSSPSPPASNPSQHQSLFQWVSSSHEMAKVLEFRLQHHSLQRNPRADLLQNGLVESPCSPRDSKSLLQHHSSKALILLHTAFFIVQLSHPSMTTGKTIAFTRWTFVCKVMSLLFNMLSSLVVTFLPRNSVFYFHGCSVFGVQRNSLSPFPLFSHLFAMKWWERCHDLSFLNIEF